jgi:putative ABC transport system permease protein
MGTVLSDARYALRSLIARPGFAAVAILTLALGIGATTAIFTVVHAVLLRPLPFPEAERLVQVRIVGREGMLFPLPDTDFVAWRSLNRTADAVAVFSNGPTTITGDGAPESVESMSVTDRFFDVLRAPTLLGRTFQLGEDRPGATKSVVLSHGLWTRRYHADPAIVGRTVLLDAEPYVVIGVMPPDFAYPPANQALWRILTMHEPKRRGPFYTWGIARIKDAVSIDELRTNLGVVGAGMKRQYPGPGDWSMDAVPLRDAIVGDVRRILFVLLGAVGFLLLIAAANVANLLLARAAGRERELAVRGALGAGHRRIAAQLVTESVVLAVVSGLAGLAFAYWGTRALVVLAPERLPRLAEVGMNGTVFLFALGVASASGVAFGIVPAIRASRTSLVDALKDGGRSMAGGRHRRTQRALVVAEIALALVLAVGAGLMVRSFVALQRVSPGFEPSHLLTFHLSPPETQYRDKVARRTFYTQLMQRLEALPGVRAAALTISLPPHLVVMTDNFMVEGQVLPPNRSAPLGPLVFVSEGYFSALGAPLLRGRFFTEQDDDTSPDVVIINETLAKRFFPGVDPVGRRIKNGGPERPIGPRNPWMTIVGVVGDINYSGLDAAPEPVVYYAFRQAPAGDQYVVLRTTADPQSLASAARVAVGELDKDLPVTNLRTMDELMSESMASPRFRTTLVSLFAVVGVLLAAIGIYGVMAYAVAERTHELGVRMALGADRGDVLRMVIGDAMRLVAGGVTLGVIGAAAASRLIGSLLFGITPTDPTTFAGIVALLTATALVASYVPARRATRVDPMIALRHE